MNEIKSKFVRKIGYIPPNIEIQTWYNFLLEHGVRPYQGSMDEGLYEKRIGFILVNETSGIKCLMADGTPIPYGEDDIYHHYFTNDLRIYSDKTSKFVIKCNKKTGNKIIDRINKIFLHVFIDEAQDLTGYDLEIIKLLLKSRSEIILVGDPRQTVYQTHPARLHKKYQYGNIKGFFENELGKKIRCRIDEETLRDSHRNNQYICDYSAKLYPKMYKSNACKCHVCRNIITNHEGIFMVREDDVGKYLKEYSPDQLRSHKGIKCNNEYPIYNFEKSKGLTFKRVLIYPTNTMLAWIKDNNKTLADTTKAELYVAITRARHSVGIVMDFRENDKNTMGYYFNDELLLPYRPSL
jgi:DNA helicase-2/ATP-dependent DNA helicase PcrA